MSSGGLTNGYILADVALEAPTRESKGSKAWIVQKFGGTSVGKVADHIAEKIVK